MNGVYCNDVQHLRAPGRRRKLNGMRAMTLVLMVAIGMSGAGCSPGMHRAYQNTMGGVALAGWGTAEVITYQALTSGDSAYRETRPMLGLSAKQFVVGAAVVNVALVAGLRLIPDKTFDEHTPWVKDVLLTLCAVSGAFDAWNDISVTR